MARSKNPSPPPALRIEGGVPATSERPFIREEFGSARVPVEPNLVFVIMSFGDDDMEAVYSAIQDECQKLRLVAKRVDENVGSGIVIKEIGALIEQAQFILCDLTHERPNVYYELGYAHGVGNKASNILLIARNGTRLHFDIAPLRVQYYSSIEELRAVLTRNLGQMTELARRGETAGPESKASSSP